MHLPNRKYKDDNNNNKNKKALSYHGINWHFDINRLHQLSNGKVPVAEGAVQRGGPAEAQSFVTGNHYDGGDQRIVALQGQNLIQYKTEGE